MAQHYADYLQSFASSQKSIDFIFALLLNNSPTIQIKHTETDLTPVIHQAFQLSCADVMTLRNTPHLSEQERLEKREKLDQTLLNQVTHLLEDTIVIKPDSDMDYQAVAHQMINTVYNPLLEMSEYIDSKLKTPPPSPVPRQKRPYRKRLKTGPGVS